jgi:predicted HicB family RNase H-like nuclease
LTAKEGSGFLVSFSDFTQSLHARLALRAKQEGVSMNLLVNTLLAESLGRRELA